MAVPWSVWVTVYFSKSAGIGETTFLFLVILWEKFQTTSLSSTQTFKTVAKMLCREGVPCCAVLTAGRCVVCRFHTPLADVFRNKPKMVSFPKYVIFNTYCCSRNSNHVVHA